MIGAPRNVAAQLGVIVRPGSGCVAVRPFAVDCAGEVGRGFSPVAPVEPEESVGGFGPGSNTGQKGGALIDYLTVVFPRSAVDERGLSDLRNLLGTVFGFKRGEVIATAVRNVRWQFYKCSASLIDKDGEMVGKIGMDGNGDSICVSLSGAGTRWVANWFTVCHELKACRAKITRCDLAFDDYTGERFNVRELHQRARNRAFMSRGTPPQYEFIDGEGTGRGSTLYVGKKGHKQLCIYEKGLQLGHKGSPWVRCEVRLYGKHCVIPLDTLIDPLAFLRGAYDVLEELLRGVVHDECTRIKTERAAVEATGEAMVEYLQRQVGPTMQLLVEAFGGSWSDFVLNRICRLGTPGRFRGKCKGETLARLIYEELVVKHE